MSWKTSSLLIGVLLFALHPLTAAEPQPASDDSALESDSCLTDVLCRARFNRGRKLSKEDNYDEAVAAYESAYQRRPVPWLLINIGRTLHKLGRLSEAVARYEQYLAAEPSGPGERKQRAEQFLKEAREELATQTAAKKPPAAPVLVVPETVPEQEPEPTAPLAEPSAPTPVVTPPPVPLVVPPPPVAPVKRTSGWLVGGLLSGSAVLIAGAATGGAALAAANTARGTLYVGDPSADAMDAQQRARSLSLAADVLFAVGAVTVVSVTTAYLIRRAVTRRKEPVVGPGIGVGKGAVSVGMSGSF